MEFFNKYFLDVVKNQYIKFEGKANREQFWYYALVYFVLYFAVMIALAILGAICAAISYKLAAIVSVLGLLIYLALALGLLLPTLGIAARRLTDGGFSPWLLLLGLIPFGGFVVLVLCALPSKASA